MKPTRPCWALSRCNGPIRLAFLFSTTFCLFHGAISAQNPADLTSVVYVVRHAEKVDDGTDDPLLAISGRIRAVELSQLLAAAGITHVHSTDTERAKATARPTAERLNLGILLYDPSDVYLFAGSLRATPGAHLVVGHSNTVQPLVAALGGSFGSPISEDEHDRVYILILDPTRATITLKLRYGSEFQPPG